MMDTYLYTTVEKAGQGFVESHGLPSSFFLIRIQMTSFILFPASAPANVIAARGSLFFLIFGKTQQSIQNLHKNLSASNKKPTNTLLSEVVR